MKIEINTMAKILLVDDDKNLCENIRDWFEHKHHSVEFVHDGLDGFFRLQCSKFDLVVLDVNLPGLTGFELSRRFRAAGGKTPIMFLTGQDSLGDKQVGFGCGADDYLVKPFFLEELFLRIQALLRRSSRSSDNILCAGPLKLDIMTFSVYRGDELLNLTRGEFALLEFFMRNPRRVFSQETIVSRVWPTESETSPESVRTFIKRLRRKIDIEGYPSSIRNVHGVGYSFEPPLTQPDLAAQ